MTTIEKPCPDCSKPAIFSFGEKIINDRLFWSASFTCSNCGYAVESDDIGRLPDNLRLLVLSEEGLWELEFSSTDVLSLKAIHQVMNIPFKKMAQLKEKIPCIIYEGTETEGRHYLNRLLKLAPNIDVIIRKAD
jgi:hypothetical protein